MKKYLMFSWLICLLLLPTACHSSTGIEQVINALESGVLVKGDSIDKLPLVVPKAVFFHGKHTFFLYGSENEGYAGIFAFDDKVHTAYVMNFTGVNVYRYYFYDFEMMELVSKVKMQKM